ncbi:MAG: hypothetical protein NVS3B8_07020 [Chitinophagaceae bacterium]
MNAWYDHAIGKGGRLVDFGILYHRCTVKEFLEHVISSAAITDSGLLQYLKERQIPLFVASQFCEQVCFELYNKKQLAIGFKNDNDGYE